VGTRTLVLVRHGQYDTNDGGRLTALGREQAATTGRFLSKLRVDGVWASTLPRARQTAAIVTAGFADAPIKHSRFLCEGLYTKVEGYDIPATERDEDRKRADKAFAMLFKKSRVDRTELVVCHGNLIRYLVCLAIDVPYARWTRMTSHHCAITRVLIRDTGTVRLCSYNETGHLPDELIT
jgi:serine/threonine-protein phosphatase PGAM5